MQAVVGEEFVAVRALPQLSMLLRWPDWEIEGF